MRYLLPFALLCCLTGCITSRHTVEDNEHEDTIEFETVPNDAGDAAPSFHWKRYER